MRKLAGGRPAGDGAGTGRSHVVCGTPAPPASPLGPRSLPSATSLTPLTPSPEANAKVNALIAEVMEPEASLEVTVNHVKIIRTKEPVTRVSFTDPKTLLVTQFTPTEFELIGLQPGQTSLTFWFGENQTLRYLVHVMPDTEGNENRWRMEYRKLQNKINEMFPNSMVQLIPVGRQADCSRAGEGLGGSRADSRRRVGPPWDGRRTELGPTAEAPAWSTWARP